MVTFGGNFIDRLIYEAHTRFQEKSQLVVQDQTVSFATFTDRSYNPRVQMASTLWLASDAHFLEMLAFVEKYTALDDNLRGDVEKRLNALLAGLLKGLMRECLSLADVGGKKIALERVYHWFLERSFELLDGKMKRRSVAGGNTLQTTASGGTQKATVVESGSTEASSGNVGDPVLAKAMSMRGGVGVDPNANNNNNAAVNGGGGTFKKAWKQPDVPPPPQDDKVTEKVIAQGPSISFLQNRREQEQRAVIDRKMLMYRRTNLTKTKDIRERLCQTEPKKEQPQQQQQPKIVYKNRPKPQTPSAYLHATPSGDANVDAQNEAAHRVWVMRRIQQLETQMDEREMKDCLNMWHQSYARIEEESNRRVESAIVASQTGRTCHHKHLSKSKESMEEVKRPPNRPLTAPVFDTANDASSSDAYAQGVAKGMKLPHRYDGGETTFSPYDHYIPSTMDRIMFEHQDNNMLEGRLIKTPDPSTTLQRLGLRPSHTPTLRSTGPMNIPLDVMVTDDTITAPSHIPTLDKPLVEQIFPFLAPTEDGPSVMRLQQLHMASRIHECFARTKMKDGATMKQSLATIQQAVLTPEDAPLSECMMLLPRPDHGYMRDYNAKQTKKAKPKKK